MDGSELKRIRRRLGWTQKRLAEELGVAENTVARWERDQLGMRSTAERLIRRLDEDNQSKTRR